MIGQEHTPSCLALHGYPANGEPTRTAVTVWVCDCPDTTQADIDARSAIALKFVAHGFRHVNERCQEQSTRIYSLGDPEMDKCWKRLPCPDHNPVLTAVQQTIENVREQYRRGLQEVAT